MERFCDNLSEHFKVGRIHIEQEVIFRGIHIKRNSSSDFTYNMEEYFNSIRQIDIPPYRRKEQNCAYTEAERLKLSVLSCSVLLPPIIGSDMVYFPKSISQLAFCSNLSQTSPSPC